jgi:hypothetical protein
MMREFICQIHINEVMRNYIINTYESLKNDILGCTSWLIYCIYDLGLSLEEILPSYKFIDGNKRLQNYNDFTFTVTEDEAILGLDTFYNIILDNI